MRAQPLITTDGRVNLCELQCRNYERRQSYTHVGGEGRPTHETSSQQGEIPDSGTGPAA